MPASSAVERLSWGRKTVDEDSQGAPGASLRDEPIMRLVEDPSSLELAGSMNAEPEQEFLDTSSGRVTTVDFAKVPASRTDAGSSQATLCALQEWEGCVVEIGDETFEARLLEVTAGARSDTESAAIPLGEISHGRDRVRVGSIFRWVIGYERTPGGTTQRVSRIHFRDLPVATDRDLRAGREWARGIMEKFDL